MICLLISLFRFFLKPLSVQVVSVSHKDPPLRRDVQPCERLGVMRLNVLVAGNSLARQKINTKIHELSAALHKTRWSKYVTKAAAYSPENMVISKQNLLTIILFTSTQTACTVVQ